MMLFQPGYGKYYNDFSLLTLLFFCGYVIIWYLQIGYRIPFLGEIRFEFIYAFLLTLIVIFDKRKIEFESKILLAIVMLFVVMIIQIPLSVNFDVSFNVFVDRVVKFSFMTLFIVYFVRSPRGLKFFIGAFLLACMKMGQEGFVGYLTGSMIWENQGVMRLNGPTPIYGHPNSFSGMAIGTLPFIIYLFSVSTKSVKIILTIQAVFALNIIVHSGSRTGYVALSILILYLFVISKRKLKALFLFFAILIVSINFIDYQYFDRFGTIFSGQDKEGASTEMRREILTDAVQIFLDNPFGVGVSAFPTARMMKFNRSQDTHNLYLEILTNLGVQGMLIFSILIYNLFKTLNYINKKLIDLKCKINFHKSYNIEFQKINNDINFLYAISNALILFIIVRLALGLFGMDLYEIYWWFASGITIAVYNIVKNTEIKLNAIYGVDDVAKFR